MRHDPGGAEVALAQLRDRLAGSQLPLNSRLPPERALCRQLAVTRAALRKALAVLEAEGQIWRHVGRGTFVGARPVENLSDIALVSSRTNPSELMQARLVIEPELARLAALNATASDLAEMRRCLRHTRQAREWRVYEAWDNRLHRAVAAATHSMLLLSLFDALNTVRRATVWGRLRTAKVPPANHHSFAEHDAIFEAIRHRDMDAAADCMRRHLTSVRDNLLRAPAPPPGPSVPGA